MVSVRKKLRADARELKKRDPIIAKIILRDLDIKKPKENVYQALLGSIISQQISVKAASAIKKRFLDMFDGKYPEPKNLIETHESDFRTVGLSKQKIFYLKNVAKHFLPLKKHNKYFLNMGSQEIIEDLTKIKGVGEWTVEMILIFNLLHPDVYSYKDYGLTSAVCKLYEINPKRFKKKNLKKKILAITEKWSPHRSLACRYLWAYKDS